MTLSADSLSADQIPALMEMVRQDYRENPNDYEVRYALTGALFERWALVHPVASIEFAKNCKSRSFQKQVTASCFSALSQLSWNESRLAFDVIEHLDDPHPPPTARPANVLRGQDISERSWKRNWSDFAKPYLQQPEKTIDVYGDLATSLRVAFAVPCVGPCP